LNQIILINLDELEIKFYLEANQLKIHSNTKF